MAPVSNTDSASIHATTVLRYFLSHTQVPLFSELKDETNCSICNEQYLTVAQLESPLKLPCGHAFGNGCILKWLNPTSQTPKNSCPKCRAVVFPDSVLRPKNSRRQSLTAILGVLDASQARLEAMGASHSRLAQADDLRRRVVSSEEQSSNGTVIEPSVIAAGRTNDLREALMQNNGFEGRGRLNGDAVVRWKACCNSLVSSTEMHGHREWADFAAMAYAVIRIADVGPFNENRAFCHTWKRVVTSCFPEPDTRTGRRLVGLLKEDFAHCYIWADDEIQRLVCEWNWRIRDSRPARRRVRDGNGGSGGR